MKRTKQDYINLLEETIQYYSENPRGINDTVGLCQYKTDEGYFCPVGRCLTEEAFNNQYILDNKGVRELDSSTFQTLVKPQYKNFKLEFWQELQRVHNRNENWNKDGLSDKGEKHMKTVTIGDIHGTGLWREIVQKEKDADKIIFVGDYTDSYDKTDNEIFANLEALISFKRANPKKVELLLGNHDWQYMFNDPCSGFRNSMFTNLNLFFKLHKKLFNIAFQYKNFLWTHAGVNQEWFQAHQYTFKHYNELIKGDYQNFADLLNLIIDTNAYQILGTVGESRGGTGYTGGPLWSDIADNTKFPLLNYNFVQIVGHTPVRTISKVNTTLNDDIVDRQYYYVDVMQSKFEKLEDYYLKMEI